MNKINVDRRKTKTKAKSKKIKKIEELQQMVDQFETNWLMDQPESETMPDELFHAKIEENVAKTIKAIQHLG